MSITLLTGLKPDDVLDATIVNAASDTEAHAKQALEVYRKLVGLVDYASKNDDIDPGLEPLRELTLIDAGKAHPYLSVGDFRTAACLAEVTQVIDPVYVQLTGESWTNQDQRALMRLCDTLSAHLSE